MAERDKMSNQSGNYTAFAKRIIGQEYMQKWPKDVSELHCFELKGSYFFYNAALCSSAEISKELFDILQLAGTHTKEGIHKELFSLYSPEFIDDCLELFDQLEEKGVFFNHHSPDLPLEERRRGLYERAYKESGSLNSLELVVSQDCNLRCSYCYAGHGLWGEPKASKMKKEVALRAIDFFMEHSPKSEEGIKISFYGGEPLLNFPVIKDVVYYIEKQYGLKQGKLSYSVTTNGTLLNEEIMEFFHAYKFNVGISIDGNKESHDSCRKFPNGEGSYDIARKNLSKFIHSFGAERIIIQAVMTPKNKDMFNIAKEIFSLGVSNAGIAMSNVPCDNTSFYFTKEDCFFIQHKLLERTEELIAEIVKDSYADNEINSYKSLLDFLKLRPMLEHVHTNKFLKKHCNAGALEICVTPLGDIYPCSIVQGLERCKIGNVLEKTFDRSKVFFLRALNTYRTKCDICWCRYMCRRGCPAHQFRFNKDENAPFEPFCNLTEVLSEASIYLYHKAREQHPDVFNKLFGDKKENEWAKLVEENLR